MLRFTEQVQGQVRDLEVTLFDFKFSTFFLGCRVTIGRASTTHAHVPTLSHILHKSAFRGMGCGLSSPKAGLR